MSAAQVTVRRALVCVSVNLFTLVISHRSLPEGITCGNQFNSSDTALEIPNSKISWASYRILTCDAPIMWLKTQVDSVGQNLSFTASVPVIPRFDPVRISTLVIGPGLPALSAADQAKVPAAAVDAIGAGHGAVLFESPADQSTCAHLKSDMMGQSSTVWNGRCHFHEPFGDSRMWVNHDEMLTAVATGEHRFAVFDAGHHTAKVAWACCDWPEDFTTAFPMPEADCPYCGTKASFGQYSSLFFEHKSMAVHAGFPVYQDCDAIPSPPTPPNATQCPNETSAADADMVQPESCKLGCSRGECHSHNIFGECVYDLEWVIPSPMISGTNVTSLIIFKGDTVKFSRKGHMLPHNLIEMTSAAALENCELDPGNQILTVEQVTLGTEVMFDTAGTFHYSCSMTGHCAAGQKLTVEVKDSSEGRRCHDHPHSGAMGAAVSMTCEAGEVKAYILGDAQYGAQADQCSEMCATPGGLLWMPSAVEGTCSSAGFPETVERKTVQPVGSPTPMDVIIMAGSEAATSPTSHVHSYEEIKCDASGDAVYDEHIVEIQTYCQGIVDETETTCPYPCFQPFEVLHLHYLECDLRPKHSLYLQIEAQDKCHMAARAPAGTQCELVELAREPGLPARDPSAYDHFWTGPGADGASSFDTVGILVTAVVVILLATIAGALASWKHDLVEYVIEKFFEVIGHFVGTNPIPVAVVSFVIFVALSGGMAMQESESDAAKLWVPTGAVALDHQKYAAENWPSSVQGTFLAVVPKEGEPGPNVLTRVNLLAMLDMHTKLMQIQVDGSEIVDDSKSIDDYTEEFGGMWTFDGSNSTRAKCSKWGPVCAMQSVLAIFDYEASNIGTNAEVLDRIAKWDAAPRETLVPELGLYKGFEVSDVMGGIGRDNSGKVESAQLFMWSMFLTRNEEDVVVKSRGRKREQTTDPINTIWEADAVCALGVQAKHPVHTDTECRVPAGDLKYTGLLGRSFGDEFGAAVSTDGARIGIAYFLIVIYLVACLGKRDVVHSMFAMSVSVLVAVGLSFTSSSGIGALMGIKTNPLNNNIPFLILGLGVDDAFVLVAELTRHMKENREASVPHLIALTAKTGGSSILITSVTDALAFLVGASTALPALSGFCVYGGIAVLICFVLQVVWVLPLLALNLRRVKANRLDCLCCFKDRSELHEIQDPQGHCCCYCCCPAMCKPTDNLMRIAMGKVGNVTVKTLPGKIGTLIFWLIIFVVGMVGATQIQKNFKLEWFFPAGSYVRDFIEINDEYFSTGTQFNVYTNEVDIFTEQDEMNELTSYLKQQDFIKGSSIGNWWENFRPDPTVAAAAASAEFYQDLWDWAKTSDYKRSLRWVDDKCNDDETEAGCDPTRGVKHTRIQATLKRLPNGVVEFETMSRMRMDINNIFDDQSSMKVFPFSQDFLYWEENGIIDTELTRNLVIAAGIVFIILCTMIPKPRIAVIVSLGICMSVVELVGFIHWWGVSVNGTTTIYLLICLGLAVDYSAHIGHIFNLSVGSAEDRALEAMTRIGPSVFHAIFSTIMAVIVLSLSKSYVFVVFFKVLCLVTLIAGFKGLWLLPAVLSLVGGAKREEVEVMVGVKKTEFAGPEERGQGA